MSYKSVLTHIVADRGCAARLRMAAGVARAFGAELVGLGAQAPWPFSDAKAGSGADFRRLVQVATDDIAGAEKAFRQGLAGTDVPLGWRQEVTYPNIALPRHASVADMLIAYRTAGTPDLSVYTAPDALVMEAGLPVMLMPGHEAEFVGEAVLLAWKNTRETRRAITMAMPALVRAKRVVLAAVCHSSDLESVELELRDVGEGVSRHGVKSSAVTQVDAPGAAGRRLLRIAQAEDCDLIVAGGYGHSRLREWVLGGVTRDLISDTRRYVLLSH